MTTEAKHQWKGTTQFCPVRFTLTGIRRQHPNIIGGKMYAITFRSILGVILPQVLNTVTLERDGNITALYSSDEVTFDTSIMSQTPSQNIIDGLIAGRTWLQSPKDLAYWSEQNGKLKVSWNVWNVDAISNKLLKTVETVTTAK